jgi:hypothetical protein
MDRFHAAFAPCGLRETTLYPCYGLAEATLMVTGSFKSLPATTGAFDRKGLETHCVLEQAAGLLGRQGCDFMLDALFSFQKLSHKTRLVNC